MFAGPGHTGLFVGAALHAGVGVGRRDGVDFDYGGSSPGKIGGALLVGGGFVVHLNATFGLGVEANYQGLLETTFNGFGVGPILALTF